MHILSKRFWASATLVALFSPISALAALPSITNLEVMPVDDGIELTWDKVNDPTVTHYKVYYSTQSIIDNDGAWEGYEETSGLKERFVFKNFTPGQKLFTGVTAVNAADEESEFFEEEVSFTFIGNPEAPDDSPARTDPFGTGGPAVTQDFVQSIAAPDSASLASSGKPVVPQPVEHLIPSQMPLAEGRSAALTTGVVIFGGDGYLGEYLRAIYPEAQCPKVDIGDRAAVVRVLDEYRPAVIINAAGKTGRPNVDWCEDHKEETLHSNVLGPLILWEECDKRGIYMAHLGSGCIYEGDNLGHGFGESDAPNFNGSFYSRTKRWSDEMLQEFPVLIARLRMPFDGSQHERNLLSKLLRYKKITTAHNSLSFLPDFFYALQVLIAQRATGAYNIVNPGAISPYEIMLMYREIVDPAHTFEPLDVKDILTQVKVERSNCVLSTAKIESAGIFLPTAEARIRQILEEWKRMPREVGDMQYVV